MPIEEVDVVLRTLDRAVARLTQALAVLAGVLVVGIMVVLLTNVVLRFTATPIAGVVEGVEFALLAAVVASFAHVQSTDSHIWVDVVTGRLGERGRRVTEIVAHLVTSVVALALAAAFWVVAAEDDLALDTSGLLPVPTFPFKVLIVVGMIAWSAEALRSAAHAVGANRASGPDPQAAL